MSVQDQDINSLKKTLRALLLSAKRGLTLQQLYNDYEMVIGRSVPYAKLGYRSFSELLRSMPDVVKARRDSRGRELFEGIADPSSAHIASMVSKQRSTKSYCRLKSTQPVISNRLPPKCAKKCPPEVPMNVKIKLRQLLVSYPDGLPLSKFQDAYNKRFGYYLHTNTWGFKNLLEALRSIDSILTLEYSSSQDDGEYILHIVKPGTKEKNATDSLNSLEKSSVAEKPMNFEEMDSPQPLPVEISKQLKELLELHPGGIWASNLPIEYMNYFNEELPFKVLGYSSVIEFITTIPDLVDLERPTGTGDWLVFAKGKKQSSPLVKSSLKPVTPIPNGLVNVILKVLENQLSPVLVDSFPSLFKEVTNRSLPVLEYGYGSCLELLKQVPGITIVHQNGSELVEICKKEETKIDIQKVEESSSDEKDETLLPSLTEKSVPKPRPLAYLCQAIPQGSKAFGVYVTYVKTPSFFCIQVIGEDSTQALDSLHEDMAQYYNSKAGDECSIDAPYIGQPCCTRFNNDGYWYRATVSGFPQPDTVEVTYVDYGNSGVVPKATLRQPKAHYLALPAQAVECRLANVIPVGGTWSRRAAQLLFQMTKDKAIAAIVTSSKGQYLSLCLCDTTTERDIHINDCLVSQGLALFSPDTAQDQGSVDKYKLEPPPSERSVDEAEIRVPDTVGSAASLISPSSSSDSSQLSSQHMMLQLMALMHQNSLLLQQPSLLASQAGQHNPFLPSPFSPSYTTNPISVDHRPKAVRTPPGLGNNHVTKKSYVEKTKSKKANIKEIQLPSPYTLHLLNYNDHPHAISKEIASWYWETDLLQYKLHQIPNSPCGLLLYRDKVPELFELLVKSQSPVLWEALGSDSITVYPLEDLPTIVQCLNGPWDLYEALKKLVTEWKEKCVVFWTEEHNVDLRTNNVHEVNVLSKKLKELQEKRTSILSALAKKSSCHESSIGGEQVLNDFLTTDKEIEILEQKLANFNMKTEEINKTRISQASFHADKLNFSDTDLVASSETFNGHCNELLSQPATVSEVVCNTNSSYPLLSQPTFINQTTTNITMGGLTGKVPLNRVRSNSSLSTKPLNIPTPKGLQNQQPQQFSLNSISPIKEPLLETTPSSENPMPTKSAHLFRTPSLNVTQKYPPLMKHSDINNHHTVSSRRKTLSMNSPFLNGPPPSANKLPPNCYQPLPPPPHLFNPPHFQTHLPPGGIGRGHNPLLDPPPFTVGTSQPIGLGRGMVRPMGWHTDQNLYPMPLIRPGAGLDVI